MEIIKSNRLILRKAQESDIVALLPLLSDKKVGEYVPNLYFNSVDDVKAFMHYYVLPCDYQNFFCFVIEDLKNKDIVGIIDAYLYYDFNYDSISVSYAAKESARGQGIIPEALKAFLLYIHNNSNAKLAEFIIREENLASLRVMEKLNISPLKKQGNCIYYNLSLKEKPSF